MRLDGLLRRLPREWLPFTPNDDDDDDKEEEEPEAAEEGIVAVLFRSCGAFIFRSKSSL